MSSLAAGKARVCTLSSTRYLLDLDAQRTLITSEFFKISRNYYYFEILVINAQRNKEECL
jgi:hypothetical protein